MEDLAVLPLYVEDDMYGVREGVELVPQAIRQVLIRDMRFVERR